MAAKKRLDSLLVERGLFETRAKASAAVLAGDVRVGNGERAAKPGTMVAENTELAVAETRRYVSRGGLKLAHALATFALDVRGLTAGHADQFLGCELKDSVRGPGGRPDRRQREQIAIDQRAQGLRMAERRRPSAAP